MTARSIEFGSFALDLDRLCLRGPSGQVDLRPKSFEVLRFLVQHAGRVVTKDELMKAVWHDVIVTDESLAVCISDVRRALGDKHQQIIKTVPKRGYLMDAAVSTTVAAETPTLPLPDKPSIAVLPFSNMSGDPEQEYFADGIVEDITTELSRIQDLFVIARTSSFRFKGRASDVRQVAHELGVRYVLEGSVRRDGDHVRISAQLIDAMTGGHRWADRYDRRLDHIFAIQDEIARNVAITLAAHVTKAEEERTLQKPPTTWRAYDYYMRAASVITDLHRLATTATVHEIRRLLDQCLAMDPRFARAHVLYSVTKLMTWTAKLDDDHLNPAALESALGWAQTALQLDPSLPQAHVQLAFVLCYRQAHDLALAHLGRAVELNPNFADWRIPAVLILAGQADRAVNFARSNLRLDPFGPPITQGYLGLAYLVLKRYSEAIPPLCEFVLRSPKNRLGRVWLTAAYAHLGKLHEARAGAAELLRVDPNLETTKRSIQIHSQVFLRPEHLLHIADGLRRAGLPLP